MAVTYYPNAALLAFANGTFDLDTATIKAMLITAAGSGVMDIDTAATRDDIDGFEMSGTNYTAGGVTVTGKALTQDNANNRALWTFDPPTFTTITGSFQYVALYKSVGTPAQDSIICWIDTEGTQTASATTFIQAVNATAFTAIRQAA